MGSRVSLDLPNSASLFALPQSLYLVTVVSKVASSTSIRLASSPMVFTLFDPPLRDLLRIVQAPFIVVGA